MLIGEVSRRAGISARMLRHYDSIGLVSPTGRTVGGYREYSELDIRRLFHVESLRSLGMSLRDLRRALDDPQFTPTDLVADLIASTRERIEREEELLRRLGQVQNIEPTEWTDVLRVVSLLRGMDSSDPSKRQRSALATGDGPGPTGSVLAEAVLDEVDHNVAGALLWALRRSGDEALDVLSPALQATDAARRHRAVSAIAQLDTEGATALLIESLQHPDPVVREHAALTLGARGERLAISELAAMIVAGTHDVEAAEALGRIAQEHDLNDRISGTLATELGREGAAFDARLRLVQALAELRGSVAENELRMLAADPDHRLALTAKAVAKAREKRDGKAR